MRCKLAIFGSVFIASKSLRCESLTLLDAMAVETDCRNCYLLSMESRIRAAFAGVCSAFETHRPVLCEAVLRVRSGLILELGAGDGSTPALHEVSLETGRPVITIEHDRAWIERYAHLRSDNHSLVHVDSWTDLDNPVIRSLSYAIAFVDHAPHARRVIDITWLAQRAKVVVVHDTESNEYGYDGIFDLFQYHTTFQGHVPWTSVLSNFIDVSSWSFKSA
jgi:hypothetical protein